MPLYAFNCKACGPFEAWQPLSEAGSPACCPGCRAVGRRQYTPPGLVRTPSAIRTARALEEKSAHQPEVVQGTVSDLPGRPLRPRSRPKPPWVS